MFDDWSMTTMTRSVGFRGELSRQKQRCQELEIQLVTDHETIVEVTNTHTYTHAYRFIEDFKKGTQTIVQLT